MEHDFMEDFESIYLMIFSRGHATTPCRVGRLVRLHLSIGNIFEFRVVFA